MKEMDRCPERNVQQLRLMFVGCGSFKGAGRFGQAQAVILFEDIVEWAVY
jgi:hypothetical protein